MNPKNTIKLRPVKKSDCQFLYNLLKERDPRANISHKNMPSYEQHVKFVLSKPYSKWYVVMKSDKTVGSVYLTKNNEIGLFIQKNMQDKGIGYHALQALVKKNPRKFYLANVSPKNKRSIRFFKNNGFELIQHTYRLESSY
ncbi:MAG: GNAT family N-acetyltransferase [Candidatus Nitrosotenuis sp.]